MDYARLFEPVTARGLRVGLVGVGEFGASFLFRSGRARAFAVTAAADADLDRVVAAAVAAGIAREQIAGCDGAAQAARALARGDFVAVTDASLLMGLDLDCIVEATGVPHAAARTATQAIAGGKHVGMVSKECDSVVGSILQAKAAAAGLVYTPVDGDQPSLAIGLVGWARTLGLDVVCAGKASEYDFVFDPDAQTVTALGRSAHVPDMKSLWRTEPSALRDCVAARRGLLNAWPHRTVPDLCELALIANATGLAPDTPSLHAPIARTLELPDLFRPRTDGGLLERGAAVDLFNCLRRPDEISFAGGVFVIVRCDDRATWKVLRGKGIPTSADGGHALLHNAVHLLGIEAPLSLLSIAALGQPSGSYAPRWDLHARTSRALARGTRLNLGERHAMAGVEPLLAPAGLAASAAPIPYYMAAGCVLAVDVAAGELLRREHLEAPEDAVLWALRDEQDARFFPTRTG